jgi:hypothetical protein
MLFAKGNAKMQKIDKEELYQHVRGFLKDRGVQLEEGSYTRRIQHGCSILADTINLSQQAMTKAATAVGTGLDRMRQAIHEKTAPKPSQAARPAGRAEAGAAPSGAPPPRAQTTKPTPRKTAKPGAKKKAARRTAA